jgi:2-keto-3-deoxy-L-rhamnonate aldolase RhmA
MTHAVKNKMSDEMARGQLALGLGVGYVPTSAMPLIADAAGFSWLFIDLEHSALSVGDATEVCMAALGVGIAPIVRLGRNSIHEGSRLLDNGAAGIVMPRVHNAADAERLVSLCKYPPLGVRSWGGPSPHLDFPATPSAELMIRANESTLAIAMIESVDGVKNAREIAETPGLDAILIGAIDLSVEMGLSGDVTHASIVGDIARCTKIALEHKLLVGLGGVFGNAVLPLYRDMGFHFLLGGIDYRLLTEAARNRASQLRQMWNAPKSS